MADDDLALPLLDDLLACLCAELANSPGGETCYCALVPGGQAVADYCTCAGGAAKCGMAWVRLVSIFPSTRFPAQDSSAACTGPLAMTAELGVYRCLPTPQGSSTTVDGAAQTQAVMTQLGDWRAMMQAVRCCPSLDRLRPDGIVLGRYDAVSQGGCGGGKMQVTLKLTRRPR